MKLLERYKADKDIINFGKFIRNPPFTIIISLCSEEVNLVQYLYCPCCLLVALRLHLIGLKIYLTVRIVPSRNVTTFAYH